MKKLIVLVIVSICTLPLLAQTTYTFATYDPLEITAPDNTNTHILQLATNGEKDVLIIFPTGNSGTVKINTQSSTITNSPSLSATTHPNGIFVRSKAVTGYKIYFRFSNTSDKVIITRWY